MKLDISRFEWGRKMLSTGNGSTEYLFDGHGKTAVYAKVKSTGWIVCAIVSEDDTTAVARVIWTSSMESIFRQSDIITFHIPLTDQTRHIVNDASLAKMKDGVILINTARGELMDTETLIAGVESEKIGALGLDVFEEERDIYHRYRTTDIIKNRNMAYLRQFPNVVMSSLAFWRISFIRISIIIKKYGLLIYNDSKNRTSLLSIQTI